MEHASYLHWVYTDRRAPRKPKFWQNPVHCKQDEGPCVIFASGILTDARLGHLNSDRILSEQDLEHAWFLHRVYWPTRASDILILTESCPSRTWSMRHICIGYSIYWPTRASETLILTESCPSRTKEHASYLHRVYWPTRASDILILTESRPSRTWSMRHICIGYTDRRAPKTS